MATFTWIYLLSIRYLWTIICYKAWKTDKTNVINLTYDNFCFRRNSAYFNYPLVIWLWYFFRDKCVYNRRTYWLEKWQNTTCLLKKKRLPKNSPYPCFIILLSMCVYIVDVSFGDSKKKLTFIWWHFNFKFQLHVSKLQLFMYV